MLENELKTLPNLPGVYQYFDIQGKLLYVGKAKNLKNRVRSYFNFTPNLCPNPSNSLRIQKMISQTHHLEFITTKSEADALILENSFIKQLHPKYNILLRDDKTYPYIYIDLNEDFPRFEITRKIIKKNKIKYFGPFFKGAKELLNALYLSFELRQKKSCKELCLFYQIKRCKGPCEQKISKQEYEKIIQKATQALLNPLSLTKNLENKMLEYAKSENYEEAALIRDQIKTIEDLSVKIQIDLAKLEDFDIYAIYCEENILSMVRFVINNGKIISSNHKILALNNQNEFDLNAIYKQYILENYTQESPIKSTHIYTHKDFEDMKLLQDLLSERFSKKFYLKSPKLGEKKALCELALENAKINIQKHLKNESYLFLKELKDFFNLQNYPNHIEIFDNSHMQGDAIVGALVTFKDGKFDKSSYRHYHLSYKNDYDQMLQILSKRALSFDKNPPPDLWLIDGGNALLKLANDIIKSSGANVDILAISKEKIDAKAYRAKGSAKDKIYTQEGKIQLSTDDKKLQFLQKLRDEAHRFAISFHQKTKRKQDLQSSKLIQLGISQGYIKKFLDYYGSFDKISKADFNELKSLSNIKIAKIIKENL
ncbi:MULTISPECIES: excinuclease ABC subunit UvrC [unclassified Campylobacter]|uniref:excinuclease ABC subunit UvrC n=1 Tax=unclassified Campylobacter TaxID=2593542 RepID=UPI0021E6995B|nr:MULTISPECIES: excinuclease ABC subunit UvrC [unclassified Campylobacter]EID4796960.1 excinuclease ABC subunit UvrC [Campylobacter lari]MCV3425256.1 excinuclease ABC subunit UvrC [Campylobacter sp. IFREMER_LSEM_CL1085]MCV3553855.1 excinuclease ABC subunit UvrC [Campylobacter sp. CNRCH_2013_0898h]